MKNNRWYFLHIPKTGGMSLIHVLRTARLCPARDWPSLVALPDSAISHFRGFAGHFGYPLVDYLQEPLRVFTFLRHPLEHALSAHAHIVRDAGHRLHQQANRLSISQFSREYAIMRNPQTRWLTRDLDCQPFRRHRDPVQIERELLRAIAQSEFEEQYSPDLLMKKAEERLRLLQFIGFVEDYESDSHRLLKSLGWSWRFAWPVPRLNSARLRPRWEQLSREEQRILEQGLQLDLALYDRARKIASSRS
jgi:hypothetical protein